MIGYGPPSPQKLLADRIHDMFRQFIDIIAKNGKDDPDHIADVFVIINTKEHATVREIYHVTELTIPDLGKWKARAKIDL